MRRFCHIGTSGYQYDHWEGPFYPKGLPKKQWFAHYAGIFDTVEINNTFYNLPSEKTFRSWRGAAPRGFLFVLKFSRYGTHMKKLKDPADSIGAFLDRARLLEDRLGPILVQLPPNWRADPERPRRVPGRGLSRAPLGRGAARPELVHA